MLFPDHASAARTLGEGEPSPGRAGPEDPTIAYGGLLIDPLRQAVTWNGIPLSLTKLERAVLASLAEPPLQAWSYERLYHAAWGGNWLGDTSALHATIKRLRRKLRAAGVTLFLESVRGVGFRLDDEDITAGTAPQTGTGLPRWRTPEMNRKDRARLWRTRGGPGWMTAVNRFAVAGRS